MKKKVQLQTSAFGIVQGRLTQAPPGELQWFPQDLWAEEFDRARDVEIDFIELITERTHNPDNPVWSEQGRRSIRERASAAGRSIYSICIDYVIDHGLDGRAAKDTRRYLLRFMEAAADLGCAVIVLPLLEESNLARESAPVYADLVKDICKHAAKFDLCVCIESLLDGAALRNFLDSIGERNIRCVFDTGNRVIDNKDLGGEIRLLSERIAHVHIKDKNERGENVLMGTGMVDFLSVFSALHDVGYTGPFVFETTRGTDPMMTARYHINTCRFFMHEAERAA